MARAAICFCNNEGWKRPFLFLKEDKMKQEKKSKQSDSKAHSTYKTKTKEDFMRWWREQDARKKKEKNSNE